MSWGRASTGWQRASAAPGSGLAAADVVEVRPTVSIAAAGDSISLGSSQALIVVAEVDNQTAGAITLTSTPNIAAGAFDGQLLVLHGAAAQLNNIVIQDITSLAGSKLRLQSGTNKSITARDQLWFRWDATAGEWWQLTNLTAN